MISEKIVEDVGTSLLELAATTVRDDVRDVIQKAYERETSSIGRTHLETILRTIDSAKARKVAVCQDTGLPIFYVKIGSKSMIDCDFEKAFVKATKRITKELPIRENLVHPLTKENPGTNTGWRIPWIYYEYEKHSDYVEITAKLPGGSYFRSTHTMLSPMAQWDEGIRKAVLDTITMAMGWPCPPTTVGVGIGGYPDISLYLANKALLRYPLGSPSHDPTLAELEQKLTKTLNKSGIGPMGLGGDTTVLATHIDLCGSHTACPPVAVALSCWINRFAIARIYPDQSVENITHRGD